MKNKKFVFAGNRANVLQKMMELKLDIVKIWAVENSYLQRFLEENRIPYEVIKNKSELVKEIQKESFDYFISNGLPIILPIDKLQIDNKQFINIHPSLLPDLRGKDPVPGALLFKRKIGTTCHYMDNGIDSGDIIAQVEIDNTPDLDAGLLYQLSFIAEAEVFEKAYINQFQPVKKQILSGNEIYYSYKENDLIIDFENEETYEIIAKVKAFSTRNKRAILNIGGEIFRCWDAEIVENKFALENKDILFNNREMFKYENKVLVCKTKEIIKFTIG